MALIRTGGRAISDLLHDNEYFLLGVSGGSKATYTDNTSVNISSLFTNGALGGSVIVNTKGKLTFNGTANTNIKVYAIKDTVQTEISSGSAVSIDADYVVMVICGAGSTGSFTVG